MLCVYLDQVLKFMIMDLGTRTWSDLNIKELDLDCLSWNKTQDFLFAYLRWSKLLKIYPSFSVLD